jgi:hypothetical protein
VIQEFVTKILNSDSALGSMVTAGLLVFGFLIRHTFAARSKTVWGVADRNHFLVPQTDGRILSIYTATVLVKNVGRKPAENVQVTFNYAPEHFEVFPHLHYSKSVRQDGRLIFSFPKVHAKELLRIPLLNAGLELPAITDVRSDTGQATRLEFYSERVLPAWFRSCVLVVFLAGLSSVLYAAVRFLMYFLA